VILFRAEVVRCGMLFSIVLSDHEYPVIAVVWQQSRGIFVVVLGAAESIARNSAAATGSISRGLHLLLAGTYWKRR